MITNRQVSPDLTPAALQAWLETQGVDTTHWGQADAKTIADLWSELQHGESTLYADPPLRRVKVVEVTVRQGTQLLIEREQHLADGRVRLRNRPPSEKMHPGEEPMDAARRCLIEELALSGTAITFPPQEITARTVRDESGSYPNLVSEYLFYSIAACVEGLPTSTFTIPNAAHADGDPVVAHLWAWVQA